MKRHLMLVPSLLILAALALSACGGGGSSDEGKIEETIETAATTSEPSACTELETQNFVEQNTQTEGAGAVKKCEEEAEEGEDVAESVDVSKVSVKGEGATADVAFTGGNFNGQGLEVALVDEGGNWKLDEVLGFSEFDAAKLQEAFEAKLGEEEGVPPKLGRCIADAFGNATQAEAEKLAFSGSEKPIEELVEGCG